MFSDRLQGIDAFDGDWTNLTVKNNVVVASSCWGMSFVSLHGSRIINNTVVDDGTDTGTKIAGKVVCRPGIAVGDKTDQGLSSNDVIIRNNIAHGLTIDNRDPNMVLDHNICLAIDEVCRILTFVTGKPDWGVYKPGMYGDHNFIDRRGAKGEFVKFDPANFVFDLRLKAGATAIGAGSPVEAPVMDITGAARGKSGRHWRLPLDPNK